MIQASINAATSSSSSSELLEDFTNVLASDIMPLGGKMTWRRNAPWSRTSQIAEGRLMKKLVIVRASEAEVELRSEKDEILILRVSHRYHDV